MKPLLPVLAFALVACQPPSRPIAERVTLPPVATGASPPLSAAVPTFSAADGVYVLVGSDAGIPQLVAWVRTMSRGISASIGPFRGHADAPSAGGLWRMRVADGSDGAAVSLRPPDREGAPWRITAEELPVVYEQRIGPLEARVRARLLVGQRFTRIDRRRLEPGASIEIALTHDVITVQEHGLVRIELPDGPGLSCGIDALMPLVGENGVPLPPPLPAAGDLGVVDYAMPKVAEPCDAFQPDAPAHGNDGVAHLFAEESGRVAGILLVSYMYAEIFVASGVTPADLARMQRAAQKELGHQAE